MLVCCWFRVVVCSLSVCLLVLRFLILYWWLLFASDEGLFT